MPPPRKRWSGRHLWLTAAGMGKLVVISPTRDARMGSRHPVNGTDVEEGRATGAAVVAEWGAGCAAEEDEDVGFDGCSSSVSLMLLVYLRCSVKR
jgi:hypothetical protein